MQRLLKLGGSTAALAAMMLSSPNGRVTTTSAMNVARASHSSTSLPDGRVLIAGGFAGSGHEYAPFASTELYDPATGRFSAAPAMHTGRSGHTATTLSDGRVLLAGGWTGLREARGTADIYDPATGSMTATGRMLEPRAGETATPMSDGRVLLVGGVDENETELASAEIFDPTSRTFSATGSMSVPRAGHTATALADGRVVIVGGATGRYPSETIHRLIEIYDPATARFSAAGELVTARYKHAAVRLKDDRVLVIGGSDHRAWGGQFQSAELFDASTRTSRLGGAMSQKRFKIPDAIALLRDGRVLVAGGSAAAEIYDPTTNTFGSVPGSLDAARYFSAASMLRDGRVLITGGYMQRRGQLPSVSTGNLFVP
jgi:hypothetical protein